MSPVARFLTFSCYRNLPLFLTDRIKDRFITELGDRAAAHRIETLAFVVMPEHVHLIVFAEEPETVSSYLAAVKASFARDVLGRWRALAAPVLQALRSGEGSERFWQVGGGFDRCVVGEELLEKIRYVHQNPVRRGLSRTSIEYRWSSARAFEDSKEYVGPPIAFDLLPRTGMSLT